MRTNGGSQIHSVGEGNTKKLKGPASPIFGNSIIINGNYEGKWRRILKKNSVIIEPEFYTSLNASQRKEPIITSVSIHETPINHSSFAFASSGSLCSELRSPQRIKTPDSANRKKTRQNPSQTFRQKLLKSSIVVNIAVMKKSKPASAEPTIFVITIRSCILLMIPAARD